MREVEQSAIANGIPLLTLIRCHRPHYSNSLAIGNSHAKKSISDMLSSPDRSSKILDLSQENNITLLAHDAPRQL
jgi:hypothetical protein